MTTDTIARSRYRETEWNFGGYRYGLEPLVLPDPRASGPTHRFVAPELVPEWAAERLRADPPARAADRPAPEDIDDLFWFRWITGHQITFVLWHVLARELREAAATGEADRATMDLLSTLAEGYSAMLLYTSSCTTDAYHRFIRPAMYRQHHGFSGSWAPDYRPVRSLFHGREPGWARGTDFDGLRETVRLNRTVHSAVAARLVPGSESLLQRSIPATRLQDRATLGVIFDQFFLTTRSPVADDLILDQLLRRLHAALIDVDRNGLHPCGQQVAEEFPAEYRTPFIDECETRFPSITARIALRSCGLG